MSGRGRVQEGISERTRSRSARGVELIMYMYQRRPKHFLTIAMRGCYLERLFCDVQQ